jgi:hypothetical protein
MAEPQSHNPRSYRDEEALKIFLVNLNAFGPNCYRGPWFKHQKLIIGFQNKSKYDSLRLPHP